MKRLVIPRYGPPEVLEVRGAPEPVIKAGEVLIRVHQAGINFSDLLARQGLYPDAPPLPCTVGYEVAGVVSATAPDVTVHRPGDRVVALTRHGGQSEVVAVPVSRVFPLPDGWSLAEGAALPVVYLTAHQMLVRVAAAQAGETVLVHSAAGGVGLAVAELGRILGLRVIGLASAAKHEVLRTYGVEPLDRQDRKWPDAVRRLAPQGIDVVLDPVGGRTFRRGYELLAPGGRLVMYGAASLADGSRRNLALTVWRLARFPWFHPLPLMNDNRGVMGVNVGHLWDADAMLRPQLLALLRYAAEGRIRPRVDRVFPLAEAAAAHRFIQERRNIGKVLLELSAER